MGKHDRISRLALSAESAAAALDMSVGDFLDLVAKGCLPPPTKLGEKERWVTTDIEAILTGVAARPEINEDIEF